MQYNTIQYNAAPDCPVRGAVEDQRGCGDVGVGRGHAVQFAPSMYYLPLRRAEIQSKYHFASPDAAALPGGVLGQAGLVVDPLPRLEPAQQQVLGGALSTA